MKDLAHTCFQSEEIIGIRIPCPSAGTSGGFCIDRHFGSSAFAAELAASAPGGRGTAAIATFTFCFTVASAAMSISSVATRGLLAVLLRRGSFLLWYGWSSCFLLWRSILLSLVFVCLLLLGVHLVLSFDFLLLFSYVFSLLLDWRGAAARR